MTPVTFSGVKTTSIEYNQMIFVTNCMLSLEAFLWQEVIPVTYRLVDFRSRSATLSKLAMVFRLICKTALLLLSSGLLKLFLDLASSKNNKGTRQFAVIPGRVSSMFNN